MFDLDREFVGQAAPDDPGIEIAWAPVVSRDRVWPIAVSPVHLREIGAAGFVTATGVRQKGA